MAAEPVALRTPSLLVDYFELTKPRVMVLLLITMVGAMVWAEQGLPPLWLLGSALLGMGLTTGGASAINHALEPDLDIRMERTRQRPVAAGRIEPRPAIIFGIVLTILGVLVLAVLTQHPLAAALALAGNLFYVGVYTMWLKRRTPQNIVIGGASGAMPPVLGWAAVTGDVTPQALTLFLIIFAWTPPHFWALALYRKHEYAKAGVPMLPVTHGDKFTRLHVLLYTIILLACSALPFVTRLSGMTYLVAAMALGAVFMFYAVKIYTEYSDELARRTFRYSILYLTLIFAALLVDHYLQLFF